MVLSVLRLVASLLMLLSLACPAVGYAQVCGGDAGECTKRALELLALDDGAGARALFVSACGADHGPACGEVGRLQLEGVGGPVASAEARASFRRGCDASDAYSCNELGVMLHHGRGGPAAEPAATLALFERGCALGNRYACVNAADRHFDGTGTPVDHRRALGLYESACPEDGYACTKAGFLHLAGTNVPTDHARAAFAYHRGCDAGNADGCAGYGYLFEQGLGVTANLPVAEQLYGDACGRGSGIGCNNQGTVVEARGELFDAARLYRASCEADEPLGCYNGARLSMNGLPGQVDREHVVAVYTETCAEDVASACLALGALHELGTGGGPDVGLAERSYQRACDLDDGWACHYLALRLRRGQRDPGRVTELRAAACRLGQGAACLSP